MTFFGEVNELSSRAICWSDDEDDDEDHRVIEGNDQFKVIIDFDNTILSANQINNIYLSLSKTDHNSKQTRSGLASIKDMNGTLAFISIINQNSLWIELNANYSQLNNHFVVKVIRSLMKQFFTQFNANLAINPFMIIVSKEFTADEQIHNLTNNSKEALKHMPFVSKCLPLIAPQMIANLIECAIIEYSTIFNYNCIAFQLPDLRFCTKNIDFIPKQIQLNILQLNASNDSNIFI